jgi:hypothetical protein
MWAAVRERFRRFAADLHLTADQITDGYSKHIGVGRALERAYYGENVGQHHPGFLVGSWGKQTQVRPPQDVDAFFVMPPSELARFDARVGNVQSSLLQEIKAALSPTYPQTDMRGDGQVVQVAFNSITLEVVPVFATGAGTFWMPDTNDGGRWKIADPVAEMRQIDDTDRAMNGNVRTLAKMIKLWKRENNVPLKSFIVELLVSEFLPSRGNGMFDFFWYDFYVRDFFAFLISRANGYVTIPGTYEIYQLGDEWLSRAQTASSAAISACNWEYYDYDVTAGQEWQKIFGSRCPIHVMT